MPHRTGFYKARFAQKHAAAADVIILCKVCNDECAFHLSLTAAGPESLTAVFGGEST